MRRVVLFGNPLRRPHSAIMHNAAFEAFGIDAHYELREVDEAQLARDVPVAREEGWLGFQITAPHKRVVMGLVDEVETAARQIGAVNSAELTEDGRLVGFNTDTIGFVSSLRNDLGVTIEGARAVVAGSGGVGHAVVHGLLSNGVGHLTVLDLDVADVERLQGEFSEVGNFDSLALDDARSAEVLTAADLFVNATSVGMLSPGPVVPVEWLRDDAAVFDVVYLPPQTELVRAARARGLRATNGLGMLVAQAAAAFVRWTGSPDPTAVMREALEPALAQIANEP